MRGELFKPCNVVEQGRECGLLHNSMLHGTNVRFCNSVRVNSVGSNCNIVPSSKDLAMAENRLALMQVQWIDVVGNDEKAFTLWDTGSTMS